jgi:hypothetical protein
MDPRRVRVASSEERQRDGGHEHRRDARRGRLHRGGRLRVWRGRRCQAELLGDCSARRAGVVRSRQQGISLCRFTTSPHGILRTLVPLSGVPITHSIVVGFHHYHLRDYSQSHPDGRQPAFLPRNPRDPARSAG